MKTRKMLIEALTILFLTIFMGSLQVIFANNKTYTVRNNNTRDYNFEHYCDSIYEVDKDYYYDVLMESDTFQLYIDEHGEWWTN